ncbi:hypothetical protein INS49_006117 [Diaporthe citri]|uniref:uncharacterized protein n=1 Tax=Diaporthe citri TaxID=83186 RepID=UPI001C7F5F34|nr:uncharacterized protein INS49_006117 [Diaporthe citri]KAG6364516.1 hypothetical protein INS49_006117 [Diaporthe citri]
MEMSHDLAEAFWRPSFLYEYPRMREQIIGCSPDVEWAFSGLNPKNRVDKLPCFESSRWRIDGGVLGTRLFAVPLDLLPNLTPLRIDVFIPDQEHIPRAIRDTLDTAAGVAGSPGTAISRHVCHALHHYGVKQPGFLQQYQRLPFGSKLVFLNIAANPDDILIEIQPNYQLEIKSSSLESLSSLWKADFAKLVWPPAVDIKSLQLVKQLHDTVTVVQVEAGVLHSGHSQTAIFKSSTEGFDHLLHELRILIQMPPHPHIMPRPIAIVTKKCGFGGKVGVVGFLLQHFPTGSLRDILPARQQSGKLNFAQRLLWCQQVTSALIHVRDAAGTFYSDLRPDNVLLSNSSFGPDDSPSSLESIVLCDFEQRGNWYEWSPDMILFQQYSQNLLKHRQLHENGTKRWKCLVPNHHLTDGSRRPITLTNITPTHHNSPWDGLSAAAQEKAMVHSLGLFMYCVFEGVSNVCRGRAKAFLYEPDVEFPKLKRTPRVIKDLINSCITQRLVRSSGDQLNVRDGGKFDGEGIKVDQVVMVGGCLYPSGDTELVRGTESTCIAVLETAKRWWEWELDRACTCVTGTGWIDEGTATTGLTLDDVLKMLKSITLETA